jgi:hypothetical protein
MESKVVRAYLLNNEVAGDSVLTAGSVQVSGWFPVLQTQVLSATRAHSIAEIRQVVTVTSAAAIVAFSKYQVAIGNTGNRREGAQNQLTFFGATAPAVLSGSPATDKYNIYFSIATKINNTASARANAGSVITITHGAVVGTFVLHEVVTGGTSGAKGYFVSDVAGNMTIAVFSGLFVNGEVITGQTSGATTTTSAPPVLGLGLRIIDIGGYFSAYTKGLFQGPNTVLVTKGFAASDLVITTAGVISRGIGSRLVDEVPQKELLSDNLRQGLFSFPTFELVIASNNYTQYIVVDSILAPDNASSGVLVGARRVQVVYANEGAAGYGAFDAAMLANFPTMINI